MPTGNEGELSYTWTAGTGCGETVNTPTARIGVATTPEIGVDHNQKYALTKQRVLYLNTLAVNCINYLEKEGLKAHEWCIFGDIIRTMHSYPNDIVIKKGRKRATSK